MLAVLGRVGLGPNFSTCSGLGQSDDGLGWIGSRKMYPLTGLSQSRLTRRNVNARPRSESRPLSGSSLSPPSRRIHLEIGRVGNVTDARLTQNDTGRGQSTRQIATRSVQSFLHGDQVISRVGMSASCLVTMSTVHGCDRQTDMTMKNKLLN